MSRSDQATMPEFQQMSDKHPCKYKPIYYGMFVESVRYALVAARKIDVLPEPDVPDNSIGGLLVNFEWQDGKKCRVIVDYADDNHVNELVKWPEVDGKYDLIAKMKPCDRHAAEYDDWTARTGIPIVPWGYIIAPSEQENRQWTVDARAWFFNTLPELRAKQDATLVDGSIAGNGKRMMTRGAFHAPTVCPERRKFFDPDLFQGQKFEKTFRDHMVDVAESATILNLCGPDNTIDRKVVEACAIGVPIVSNDGLNDLRLPYGERFIHGENVWFVSSGQEIRNIHDNGMPLETRRRLSAGGRALYEKCFNPASVGKWMIAKARERAEVLSR